MGLNVSLAVPLTLIFCSVPLRDGLSVPLYPTVTKFLCDSSTRGLSTLSLSLSLSLSFTAGVEERERCLY